jgi:hypothetical protein
MTREGVAKLVNLFCAAYGKDCSAPLLSAWGLALSDIDDNAAFAAGAEVLKTHRYASLPTPADIRRIALGDLDDISELAWASVIDAIRRYGHGVSVDFEDDAISAALVTLGGWERLCDQTTDEMKWVKKEFIKLYKAYARNGCESYRLVGFYERTNGRLKEDYYQEIKASYPVPAPTTPQIAPKTIELLARAAGKDGDYSPFNRDDEFGKTGRESVPRASSARSGARALCRSRSLYE